MVARKKIEPKVGPTRATANDPTTAPGSDVAPFVNTTPNSYVEAGLPDQVDRVIYALPENHLGNLVRAIRTTSTTSTEQLRNVLSEHIARLDIGPCEPLAGIPEGSDQVDMMSIYVWAGKIRPQDNEAKTQIGRLLATCLARLGEQWPAPAKPPVNPVNP